MKPMENWVMSKAIPSFAKDLHVLVVDHDKHSLNSISSMLQNCSFKVTTSELGNAALTMISEEKDEPFKLVMVDACLPDMSSFSFLHHLLQMDIPLILMYSKIDMNIARKAISDLGCQILEKPISMEDIELVWQQVYRKTRNPISKRVTREGKHANHGKKSHLTNEIGGNESTVEKMVTSASEARGDLIEQEESKDKDGSKVDICDEICEEKEIISNITTKFDQEIKRIIEEEKKNFINQSKNKRTRMVWSSKLHRKFTEALSKLGNQKASPKIIHQMMNEPTLTIRQVSSHLQKYKSRVKHLNKRTMTVNEASDTSCSFARRIHFREPYGKQMNKLGQAVNTSEIRDYSAKLPKFPVRNVMTSDFRLLKQNYSSSVGTDEPHDVQPETYGGFERMNVEEEDRVFNREFNMNGTSENFVLSDYNQSSDGIQDVEFAQNLASFLYSQNQKVSTCNSMDVTDKIMNEDIMLRKDLPSADSINQYVTLKEITDLLNDTEEDPMKFFSFDELDSVETDEYNQWLNI